MARALTAVSIEKLKPTHARREISDAVMPGLYLVIQPSGSKSWAVRYRRGGKPQKFTLGSYPTFDLVDARKRARDALQAIENGKDPMALKRAAKAAISDRDLFPAVASQFVNQYCRGNNRNRSWAQTARNLGLVPAQGADKFDSVKVGLADTWRKLHVGEISKRDVNEAVNKIKNRGRNALANRTFAALRRMFGWCVEQDILVTSPCTGAKAPAKETSRTRVLTDDEIRWLWQATDEQSYPFGPLAKLLLLTGQRRAEVAGMSTRELGADGIWRLSRDRTKNDREHFVPLPAAVLEILNSIPRVAGDGLIFTKTGTTPVSGFSRAKRSLDDAMLQFARRETRNAEVTIETWTLHDLRRTCASGMAGLGIAPHIVEAVLNHKSGTISGVAAVYNRFEYVDEKRNALEAWSRRIDKIVTGKSDNVLPFAARA